MDGRLAKVLSFAILSVTLLAIAYLAYMFYTDTYEEVDVRTHSIKSHSLGLHQQSELVRARVIIDEGSVKVLEGRVAIMQLLDSDNRASMEQGKGYIPLVEVEIDTKETDVGLIEYTAHRTDTYYLVYRNEDWWNLTLLVANGNALDTQFSIKVYTTALVLATLVVFAWAYGRLFDVNVRHEMGFVRRPKGPGARSAQEPAAPSVAAADMVLEAEGEGEDLLP